jgi:hypothetical protein
MRTAENGSSALLGRRDREFSYRLDLEVALAHADWVTGAQAR